MIIFSTDSYFQHCVVVVLPSSSQNIGGGSWPGTFQNNNESGG